MMNALMLVLLIGIIVIAIVEESIPRHYDKIEDLEEEEFEETNK